MVARTPADAAKTFRESLQQALDCVVDARLNVDGYRPSGRQANLYTADLNGGLPVPFGRGSGLHLVVVINYRIVEDVPNADLWIVRIAKYEYAIVDREEQEILAYHWHPGTRGSVPWPHLHLGSVALSDQYKHLRKTHVRIGPVSLGDVLWFAIHELGVQPTPRRAHSWENILTRDW